MNSHRIFRALLLSALTLLAFVLITGCEDNATNENNNASGSFPGELLGTWLSQAHAEQQGSVFFGELEQQSGQLVIRSNQTWTYTSVENGVQVREAGRSRWIAPSTLVIYFDTVQTSSHSVVGDSTQMTCLYGNEWIVLGGPDTTGSTEWFWQLFVKQGLSNGTIAGLCIDASQRTIANVPVSASLPNATAIRDTSEAHGFFMMTGLTNGTYTVTGTYNGNTQTRTIPVVAGTPAPVLLTFTTSSSNGTLSGRIFNSNDSTALSGVTVSPDVGGSATTNANGDYSLSLTAGSHLITVSMSGFRTSYGAVFVSANQTTNQNFFLAPTNAGPGTVTGYVRDATNNNAIAGATVEAENGQSATTNANGQYTLSVDAGTRAIVATKTGYNPSNATILRVVTGQTTTLNFSLAPQFTGGQGRMRLVLRWGTQPYDLDSHLLTPGGGHVYFGDDGDSTATPFALLDVDDTSGEGPETITIYQFSTGTYKYYIHNWSGSPDITTSNAIVYLYGDSGLIQQLSIPTTPVGNRYWYICDIDGATQAITIRNTLQAAAPTDANGKMPLMMAKKY